MKGKDLINEKSRSEWLTLIKEWVHSADDRHILERYLLDGLTVETLAEEINLSVVQTQKRLSRARTQLFKHI